MFSYRHSFHAGNHGDVLKHVCQVAIIEKLKLKEKGFIYFDTHSGAGVYDLKSAESLKTKEFKSGVERINDVQMLEPNLQLYSEIICNYQKFNQYPGSPEIAKTLLRDQDQMVLMEWHNQEINKLKHNLNGKNIAIHHRDGFEGLLALTPPKLKRGLVLIDPPYEVESEYQSVIDTVAKVHKKWNSGIFVIWYPLIQSRAKENQGNFEASATKQGKSENMLQQLATHDFKNMLKVELCVSPKDQSEGMYGSGLAIINAPWGLDKMAKQILSEITPSMGLNDNASSSVEWLINND